MRQFQCVPTTYVLSINEVWYLIVSIPDLCTLTYFHHIFFHKFQNFFLMFQCNEHEEMNKFLCSLACTWITIIDSQFYIIDSLSLDISLE